MSKRRSRKQKRDREEAAVSPDEGVEAPAAVGETPPVEETPPVKETPAAEETPAVEDVEPAEDGAQEARVFAFPTRSRCPRCGGSETRAYSTKADVQYRECLTPICRVRYAVKGQPI